MAKKPLVDTMMVTEFGGVEESEVFRQDAGFEYTYVPGYSEKRRQRDAELLEVAHGERKAHDVSSLPVRLHWTRCSGNYTKTASRMANGYRAVTKADLDSKPAWLTAMPPGAKLSPSGEITTAAGDLVLMVADQKTAARNAARVQRRQLAQSAAIGSEADGFLAVGQSVKGARPTITKTTG